MRFISAVLISSLCAHFAISKENCFKVVGNVIESTESFVDISYRDKSVRLHYKVAERKNILPQGITVVAYFKIGDNSRYVTEHSALDIMRRYLANSEGSFEGAKLTKDGKCLRKP